MSDDDSVILCIAAGRNEGTAVAGRMGGCRLGLLLIQHWHVVIRKLLERVQRHDVQSIGLYSLCRGSFDYAVDLALILFIDRGP